jgi:hypothetical protein
VSKELQITNSLLWASAIVASAVLQAPHALTFLVLPSLAVASWLFTSTRNRSKD